jgi:tRNA-dihydrouridine synthase A
VKQAFPALTVIVNGGLRTVPQISEQLAHADGVMLGREAYHNPWLLPALHRLLFDDGFAAPGIDDIAAAMRAYAERQVASGTPLRAITRHLFGLHAGRAGARAWRRALSAGVSRANAAPALIEESSHAASRCR